MEAVHRDVDFSVTSIITQQHQRRNLGIIKNISQRQNLLMLQVWFPGSKEGETKESFEGCL